MSTRLQRSMHPRHHVYMPAARLWNSVPPYLPVATSTASPYVHTFMLTRLKSGSRALYLYLRVHTIAARLQRSMPAYRPIATPTTHLLTSRAPCLHTSTSTLVQRACGTPYIHVYTPGARPQGSRVPRLHTSTPTRRDTSSAPQDLRGSVPPYFHVYAPAAPTPRALYLHASP